MDSNKWINRAGGLMMDPQTVESIVVGLDDRERSNRKYSFLERRDLAKSRAIRTRWKDRRKDIFFSLPLSTKNPCSHFEENDSSISNRSNFLTFLSRRVSKDLEEIFEFSSRKRT